MSVDDIKAEKQFRESDILPNGCPPAEAEKPKEGEYFRLVDTNPPSQQDFDSIYKLTGKERRNIDLCRLSSCSLFLGAVGRRNMENKRKLPKLRKKLIIKIRLNEEAGLMITADSGHCDLWMYSDFDPVKAVVSEEGEGAQ
ncbi:MAG: hypothetical protein HQL53_09205 [Magnetococcales bacterium]|nr:hypothetical protein [Magnetococcales bacterium]